MEIARRALFLAARFCEILVALEGPEAAHRPLQVQ